MSLLPTFNFGDAGLNPWLDRSPEYDPEKISVVSQIIADVKLRGIDAVREASQKFDSPGIENVLLDCSELPSPDALTPEQKAAIDHAIERVTEFHETQFSVMTSDWEELGDGTFGWRTEATTSDEPGFEGQRLLPIQRIGVYVPGGQATYPSSVIMNVIPAKVAGAKSIVVATPPQQNGTLASAVVYALQQCGVEQVILCGGAAAIAGLAFGWDGFERVDKIVGPGNSYVTEAKRQLWGTVGLDSFAGPSEVAVYIDNAEYAAFAAADLITQVEHAPDNVGMLLAANEEVLQAVLMEAETQLTRLPRSQFIREALAKKGCAVVASEHGAIQIINSFAPEHLSLITDDAPSLALQIQNCGCVLLGPFTPQSCGDFISGPSHTLPTSGAARFSSPVNVADFLKFQSISLLNYEDLEILNPTVQEFGKMEGFPGHAYGTQVRINYSPE